MQYYTGIDIINNPRLTFVRTMGARLSGGSAKPPGIDRPIIDGNISTASETTIVSHATARLEIIESHGGRVHLFLAHP